MVREISAGGVVVRKRGGAWWMAAIEPPSDASSKDVAAAEVLDQKGVSAPARTQVVAPRHSVAHRKRVLALPKGLVDPGEKPLQTAIREVFEETGVTAELIVKLGDSKYVYTRAWGDMQRVFKIVSFYLMKYRSGRINDITEAMRIEVARARWVRLDDAGKLLAYGGEKQMARKALEYVKEHPDL